MDIVATRLWPIILFWCGGGGPGQSKFFASRPGHGNECWKWILAQEAAGVKNHAYGAPQKRTCVHGQLRRGGGPWHGPPETLREGKKWVVLDFLLPGFFSSAAGEAKGLANFTVGPAIPGSAGCGLATREIPCLSVDLRGERHRRGQFRRVIPRTQWRSYRGEFTARVRPDAYCGPVTPRRLDVILIRQRAAQLRRTEKSKSNSEIGNLAGGPCGKWRPRSWKDEGGP